MFHCEGGGTDWQHKEADITQALQELEGAETHFIVSSQTGSGDAGERFYVDNVTLLVSATGKEMTTFSRDVSLKLSRHLKATGTISTRAEEWAWEGCRGEARVKLQRKMGTHWGTLKTTTTDSAGNYTTRLPDKQGKYRVLAPLKQLDVAHRCAKAISPIRAHLH